MLNIYKRKLLFLRVLMTNVKDTKLIDKIHISNTKICFSNNYLLFNLRSLKFHYNCGHYDSACLGEYQKLRDHLYYRAVCRISWTILTKP